MSRLRKGRRVAKLAGIVPLLVAAVVVPAVSAGAAPLPFTDPSANGFIGLCNRAGQPVTSGSLLDLPFVWTAVSSTPAPDGYGQGKATLYAFQPRPQTSAGEWSGEQLTGSSTFTNPAHPMAQATNGDRPLIDVAQAYPPKVDGLLQLRLYFTGINLPSYSRTYPATVIRVTGNTWSVVSGGTVACNAGHATSNEVLALPSSALTVPGTGAVVPPGGNAQGAAGKAGGAGAASGSSTTGPGSTTPGSQPPTGGAKSAAGVTHPSGSHNSDALWIILVIAAVAALGGGAAWTVRRNRAS